MIMMICIPFALGISLILIACCSGDGRARAAGYWLWSDARGKLFDAVFQYRDPIAVGKKLGLEYDKYMLYCRVVNKEPDLKVEVMDRVIGSIAILLGFLLSMLSLNPAYIFAAVAVYFLLVIRVVNGVEASAKRKKQAIVNDLPRFADLLHSILMIDVPIETAIDMTAKLLPGTLSDEMMYALTEMQIGTKNWQEALETLAAKYEVDIFSDFVLDLVTASNKGVPIGEAVAQKSFEIKQQKLMDAKEKVSKMNNNILLPVAVFKILPLLLILMVPIMLQIYSNF